MKTMTKIAVPATAAAAVAMFAMTGPVWSGAHSKTEVMMSDSPALSEALAATYRAMADEEAVELDPADEAHFDGKADAASRGELVKPDAPGSRQLAGTDTAYAERTYQRILNAYDSGAAQDNAALLAEAQTSYDCWLQESEEGYQLLHIWRCRDAANAALNAIENPPVAAAPAPATPEPLPPQEFTVYFAFDSAELSASAQEIVASIAAAAGEIENPSVAIVGHTDTSGSQQYNQALSIRRADAVADALASRGVSASATEKTGVGELVPAVQTGDGVREPLNRRAIIVLKDGE